MKNPIVIKAPGIQLTSVIGTWSFKAKKERKTVIILFLPHEVIENLA
jgi:hypothetical protein